MESRSDIIPEGIAASTIDIVYCRSTKPIFVAIRNATNGKNINFITEVKAIIDFDLDNAEKSIDKPKAIMINGMAPCPR